MTEKMRAAVYEAPEKIVVHDLPVPNCGSHDVLVRVRACGVCGSDVHTYKKGMYVQPGQVVGHEFIGEAVVVGDQIEGIAVGDRVTGFTMGFCGKCFWCQRGQYGLCPEIFANSMGYGRPGAFADYVLIERAVLGASVHRVPDSVPVTAAATVEPVSVAVGTVTMAEVQPGDSVVVLGGGLIGNACLQVAKASGAGKVVLVEVSPSRLAAAEAAGADAVFDARTGDPLEWVKQEIGVGRYHFGEGGMADVVIEAAGAPQTIVQSFEMVRSGGTIAFVGLPENPAPIDTTKIVHKAPRIVGCLGGDFGRSIELLATEQVKTEPLVTHTFDLDDVDEAFRTQLRADDVMKVVVTMDAS
ncbi:zinc-dependent alcohol dehydrogenase [Cryptosporangium phraense]|uniref:Zinc-binding dehydrogenase n=1 Tax=Cryptosporangium phraense TaxID=2593070 RepID=A0A545AXY8_9ACTN|nr:zinc-binding dehydrogenase [Cryptosporangium phraense]TQS46141.1 zinc-binding dehydrogenase [Cryptosporangium phraense]